MRKFLLSFLATLVVFPALAQEEKAFELVTYQFWPNNSKYTASVQSTNKAGETTWTMTAFNNNNNNPDWSNIRCGRKSDPSVAKLVNNNPISDAISKVVVSVMRAKNGIPNSVKLYVASNKQMSDAVIIDLGSQKPTNNTWTNAEWEFNIPSPASNKYYLLEIDMPKCDNGVIGIDKLTFYKDGAGSNKTPTSIKFVEEEYTLTLGDDINIGEKFDPKLIMNPEGLSPIIYESSNPSVAIANENNFIIKGSGTTELRVSYPGNENFEPCEDTCNLTIIDPDVKKRFELVTGVDELSVGDKIVVVNSKSNPILTISPTPNTSQSSLKSVSSVIDVKDNQTWVNTEDAAVFTIVNGTTDENGNTAKALQYQNGKILILSEAKPQGFSSSDSFDSTGNKSTDEKANVSFEMIRTMHPQRSFFMKVVI